MATTTTPQPFQAHPEHLESFGTHCSLPLCNVSDFLPFRCPYCALSFCGDHRLPDAHQCTSPLSASRERTATQCPLCGEVLPIVDLLALPSATNTGEESGDNVDKAMELHLDSGRCRAMQTDSKGILLSPEEQEAKKRKQGSNVCAYNRCRNKMWIDLKCRECGKGFCPTHREGKAHRCAAAAPAATGSSSSGPATLSPVVQAQLPSSTAPTVMRGTSRASGDSSNPAAAGKTGGLFGKLKNSTTTTVQKTSINKSQPTTSTSGTTSSSSARQPPSASATRTKLSTQAKPESQSPSGGGNVLSQTLVGQPGILGKLNQTNEERTISKRAAAEQQAALLSLRNRAEKGLLNDDGKIKLATLEAELGKKNGRLPSSIKMGNTSAGAPSAKKGEAEKKKDCCIS